MAENSNIEWTDNTWNPWLGCTKISPACTNCYAEGWSKRSGLVKWGKDAQRRVTSDKNWREPQKWNEQAKNEGQRKRVFCSSLADVFEDHPSISQIWRDGLHDLILDTPYLDWLLLTKRPENVNQMIPESWRDGLPHNVWLGTTVENQKYANKRIPELLKIPARVRFLSIEPMLGPIDVTAWLTCWPEDEDGAPYPGNGLNWIIAGGESGPNARPSHPDWFRSLREQCNAAGVPFFFKQWGNYAPVDSILNRQHDNTSLCNQLRTWTTVSSSDRKSVGQSHTYAYDATGQATVMQKMDKHQAGRLLDDRTWDEMPEVD